MAVLTLLCSVASWQVWKDGGSDIQIIPVVILLLGSSIFVAATTVALASNNPAKTIFGVFSLLWTMALVLSNFVFIVMCQTEAESVFGALVTSALSCGTGFFLVSMAEKHA